MEDTCDPSADPCRLHDKQVQTTITVSDSDSAPDASVVVNESHDGAGRSVGPGGCEQLEGQLGLLRTQLSNQIQELSDRMEKRLDSLQTHVFVRLGLLDLGHFANDPGCGEGGFAMDPNSQAPALPQQPQEQRYELALPLEVQQSLVGVPPAMSGTASTDSLIEVTRITRSNSAPQLGTSPRPSLNTVRSQQPLRFSMSHSSVGSGHDEPTCSPRGTMRSTAEQGCSEWGATCSSCSEESERSSLEELEPICSEMPAASSFAGLQTFEAERATPGSFFEDLCQAMQGHWVEVGGKRKHWLVEGRLAIQAGKGGHHRQTITLTQSADGGIAWGAGNKFYLDHLDQHLRRAVWCRRWDGGLAFVWRALDTAGGLPPAPGPPEERRLDPDRHEAYTWYEMCAVYAGVYSIPETGEYWRTCTVVSQGSDPASSGSVMRRVDPATGESYTWEEMMAMYSEEYEPSEVAAYWTSCKEDATWSANVHGAVTSPGGLSSSSTGIWVPRPKVPATEDRARPGSVGAHPASMPSRAPGNWVACPKVPAAEVVVDARPTSNGYHLSSMSTHQAVGTRAVGKWVPRVRVPAKQGGAGPASAGAPPASMLTSPPDRIVDIR